MSTLESIKSELQEIIADSNATTGGNATTVRDGVDALIGGYGSGEIALQEKTATVNGEVVADDGYDGLSKVTVNIPVAEGVICRAYVFAPVGATVTCSSYGVATRECDEYYDGMWIFNFTTEIFGIGVTATVGEWSKSFGFSTFGKDVVYVNLTGYNPIFHENTWEEIIEASNSGIVPAVWIGQNKQLTLTSDEVMSMQVADLYHDDLSDGTGKAPITLISANTLATKYCIYNSSSSSVNTGGWNGSYSKRSWCNSTIYNLLPENVRSVVKTVNKLSDGGYGSTELVTTSDLCWFPSVTEVSGDGLGLAVTLTGQGEPYPIFVANANDSRRKWANNGSDSEVWWLRSSQMNTLYGGWTTVGKWGGLASDVSKSSVTNRIAFGFCI